MTSDLQDIPQCRCHQCGRPAESWWCVCLKCQPTRPVDAARAVPSVPLSAVDLDEIERQCKADPSCPWSAVKLDLVDRARKLARQAEDATGAVLAEIRSERMRQDAKWGQQNHDFPLWLAILSEEIGEASREYLHQREDAPNAGTHAVKLRKELVQVAAVAAQMLEVGDRNGWWAWPSRALGGA